jgi:malonate-semialdehyde dehydrogenase (acetylating)/methylmalonate-semialdehyde dehydrogenase
MLSQNKRYFSKVYKNFINGKWVDSKATKHIDIICPLTQNVLAKVPESTQSEFDEAVENANDTFKTWKKVPISSRVRYMLKY